MEAEKEEEDILGLKESKRGFGRAIEGSVGNGDREIREFLTPGKVIVYISSIEGADSLGEEFGCEEYH